MKYCAKCGKEIMDDAVICPSCGVRCDEQGTSNPAPIQQVNINNGVKNNAKDKVNIKKTMVSNIIPVLFLVIGLLMFVDGMDLGVPSDYLYPFDVTEYVGGDAYNYIIEASLRGGRIAAAEISKCINVSIGLLIACVSALRLKIVKEK